MKSNYLYNLILQILLLILPFILLIFLLDSEIYHFFSVTYLFIFFFLIILVFYTNGLLLKVEKYSTILRKYLISFLIFLGIISYILSTYIDNNNEIVIILLTYFFWGLSFLGFPFFKNYKKDNLSFKIDLDISLIRITIDLLLFLCIYFFNIHFILKKWIFSSPNILIFIFFVISWFISSSLGASFAPVKKYKRIKLIFYDYIITYLLLISISYFFISIVLSKEFSDFIFPLTVYLIWSLVITVYRYITFIQDNTDEVKTKLLKATTYVDILNKNEFTNGDKYNIGKEPLENEEMHQPFLDEKYFIEFPDVLNFIDKNIKFNNLKIKNSLFIRSTDIYNIKILEDNNLDFFVNLHKINDIRRINEYFIELNKKIKSGGVVVGRFIPIKFRLKYFLDTYPQYLSHLLYFFDFIWKRICPKLPLIKKVYFFLTRGKERALSFSEGLGRLYYCGFEVISLKAINNYLYFIVKKVNKPSSDKDPSYGPLFKMQRIGQNGKIINVYKFRTMHPYSEYLQKFTYNLNELESGGKIKNDFRITKWGKILRVAWFDELPMLINLFKGDLKLVGVRPLSKHYLSLYPEDVRKLRLKYKPGLIPPFYADLPKTFEEIIESEVRYLKSYEKNHITTDFRYFFLIWYNILIKKARSA